MGIATNLADKYQACIDKCNSCTQTCYECYKACLNEPDVNARKNCIGMLIECAQMCQMSTSLMSMDGQFIKEHCTLCATICDKCAAECDMFQNDHCTKCATECYACAEECKKMTSM